MAGNWRKSRRSQAAGNNCVETRLNGSYAEIRDSKATASGTLAVASSEFVALLESVKLVRWLAWGCMAE
ncbi:uncharacterized protein DUF397 [Stackebrandtia endophytica]|uniref:Uncharacterized protein DUF397 n=1 Tax=Stackebrandtia endophytica TaxID=1496996 RepID=A0A543B313_9ACTN|nr:DUF397 domain-containing protein [Stackebrandtia endophytica]TQL79235.1 uncharacterized protein DUF397 [Stackebrandtia endophytica]